MSKSLAPLTLAFLLLAPALGWAQSADSFPVDDRLALESKMRTLARQLVEHNGGQGQLSRLDRDAFLEQIQYAPIDLVETEGQQVECRSDWIVEPGNTRLRRHAGPICWERDERVLRISAPAARQALKEGEEALQVFAAWAFTRSFPESPEITIEQIKGDLRYSPSEGERPDPETTTGTHWSHPAQGQPGVEHRSMVRVGVSAGGEVDAHGGSPTAGVAGLAHYVAENPNAPGILPFFSATARGAFEGALDRPLYSVQASAVGNVFPAIAGVWVAVEANQFQRIRSRILRLGLPILAGIVERNGTDYVMVGVFAGMAFRDMDFTRENGNVDQLSERWMTFDLSLLMRKGEFFVAVNLSGETGNDIGRFAARGSIGIPANLISKRDGFRLEAEYVQFFRSDSTLSEADQHPFAATLRAVYELRF